ncbi:MAG: hypothetical protein K2Y22_10265 [Candidatus Obscuribacterales bacterium]|nr:hypothetical protein [Candidatus Obscuribacterales bacterium]
MIFIDRKQAGQQLAVKLQHFLETQGLLDSDNLVIVGLPRGGVPVAVEIARLFGTPVEVMVSKKLPYPNQPECAIGAVSSDGIVVLNPSVPRTEQWNVYIEEQRRQLLSKTRLIESEFYALAERKPATFEGKTVILVDDGIATGMTALAAVQTARTRGAQKVILATPVISQESYSELSMCCTVIAVSVPREFQAVGLHYANFTQTTNDEVVMALKESAQFKSNNHLAKR